MNVLDELTLLPSRRGLLFAAPGFSAAIAADAASLVIDAAGSAMHIASLIPTAELVELAVRDDDRLDARHTIATHLAPAGAPRWLEIRFTRHPPWLLGPFTAADAATLARASREWRAEHPLDREAVEVEARELIANPTRWHSRRIVVTGEWCYQFERSSFANAWLHVPGAGIGFGTYRVIVVGTWIYPDANATGGYGHFGCWPGMLRAETIEIVAEDPDREDPDRG